MSPAQLDAIEFKAMLSEKGMQVDQNIYLEGPLLAGAALSAFRNGL